MCVCVCVCVCLFVCLRRDQPGKAGKVFDVSLEAASLTNTLQGLLTEIQGVYLDEARAFRDANIVDVTTYDELKVREKERRLLLVEHGCGWWTPQVHCLREGAHTNCSERGDRGASNPAGGSACGRCQSACVSPVDAEKARGGRP